MSVLLKSISWNKNKIYYDILILFYCSVFLIVYISITLFVNSSITFESLLIKSTATLSICMLTFILSIGPLCRINSVFLPLLYNRRHLGIAFFLVASVHGVFAIIQFNGFSATMPFDNFILTVYQLVLHSNIPFELYGLVALTIFLCLALTSHDFWLLVLGKENWKYLHMLIYPAYYFVLLHVLFGFASHGGSYFDIILLLLNFLFLTTIHLLSSFSRSVPIVQAQKSKNVLIGHFDEFKNMERKIIQVENNKIFVFRIDDVVYAVDNACKHQGGPLSEGLLKDNCITCPWHGYQYNMINGKAPFPYHEKINTYKVILDDNQIWVELPSKKD